MKNFNYSGHHISKDEWEELKDPVKRSACYIRELKRINLKFKYFITEMSSQKEIGIDFNVDYLFVNIDVKINQLIQTCGRLPR